MEKTRRVLCFQRVAKAFVLELIKADLLSEVLCASAKDMKQKKKEKFSVVSRREHCIHEAASQIDRWHQGTNCKNV